MDTLLQRFKEVVKGVIEGFDRIVFKGVLRPIAYTRGMQSFLYSQNVLNKNYKDWTVNQSAAIIKSAEEYTKSQCGHGIQYLSSSRTRKEAIAHEQQSKIGIKSGLIGTWSCVESCRSYKAFFDRESGFPKLNNIETRCKHLYFYYDHSDLGFMSVRLQTWAPFEIQIALNGREWLRRMLDKEGVPYILQGNKFLHIDDYKIAQQLLDVQLDTRWESLLTSFLPFVFPTMGDLFTEKTPYTYCRATK